MISGNNQLRQNKIKVFVTGVSYLCNQKTVMAHTIVFMLRNQDSSDIRSLYRALETGLKVCWLEPVDSSF